MPRQYDKYGFNRQYLRHPVRRKSPFPHRLPFCDGFSTSALMHKVVSAPPSKSASVPQDNIPSKPGVVPGDLTRREPLPPDLGRNHYKRMSVNDAFSNFFKREGEMLAVDAVAGIPITEGLVTQLGPGIGPLAALGVAVVAVEIETWGNVAHLLYDLVHKKQTEKKKDPPKRASPYGPSRNKDPKIQYQ
jgi:hypothetical protein